MQTALARLCQHWDRVRRSDDVDAYVRRSVVNASHSRFRRRRVPTVPLAAAASVGVTAPGLTAVEDRAGLAAALASLPRRQRQVLVLRFVEDLSEQATSDALGCSVGTVKSTASRGLARLRDLLVVRARQAPSGPLGVVARRLRDRRRRHQAGRGQVGESQAQEVGGSESVTPS